MRESPFLLAIQIANLKQIVGSQFVSLTVAGSRNAIPVLGHHGPIRRSARSMFAALNMAIVV